MRAVILAAGMGRRLGDAAEGRPKCLVQVGGRTILSHQLKTLIRAGIKRFVVVVGYRAGDVIAEAKRLVGERATIIFNPWFNMTNTAYSLWLASRNLKGGYYYLNGDVLFSSEVIGRLREAPSSALAVETKLCGEEEVKVVCLNGRVTRIGKGIDGEAAAGEFIGIARFDGNIARDLHKSLGLVVNGAGDRMAYFEEGLSPLLASHFVAPVDVSDLPAVEIDFPEDLTFAREVVLPQITQLELVL